MNYSSRDGAGARPARASGLIAYEMRWARSGVRIDPQSVRSNYSRGSLLETIVDALKRAGKNLEKLAPEDLSPIDEFHTRGRTATAELAKLASLSGGESVLDLGSGLGGPSRFLATHHACQVNGIDLTPDYVAVARELTRRTRLDHLVSFREGSALAIPFAAATFDVVWSQNVAMNIADRPSLYGEVRRVLRPAGKYALSDVVLGKAAEPHYPVPWARDASASFLLTEDATRLALEQAGFHVLAWENTTDQAFAAATERAGTNALPPLGLHLLFGSDWPAVTANMLRNYREQRIGLIQAVVLRSD